MAFHLQALDLQAYLQALDLQAYLQALDLWEKMAYLLA